MSIKTAPLKALFFNRVVLSSGFLAMALSILLWKTASSLTLATIVAVVAPEGIPLDAYRISMDGQAALKSLPAFLRPEVLAVCTGRSETPLAMSPSISAKTVCQPISRYAYRFSESATPLRRLGGEAELRAVYTDDFLIFVLPIFFLSGALMGAAIELKTRRKLLETEKNARNQETTRIATQVAHDIKSPLSALSTVQKMIATTNPELSDLVQIAVSRIREISADLSQSPFKSRSRAADPQLAPLLRICIEVLSEKRLETMESQTRFIENFDREVLAELRVPIEPKELSRVLSNILNNSIEALAGTGVIYFSVTPHVASVEIEIRDNGRGIPPQILPELGKQGFTFDKPGGSGLGLSHAFRIIRATGGDVTITSEVGVGTTVCISLPLVARVY